MTRLIKMICVVGLLIILSGVSAPVFAHNRDNYFKIITGMPFVNFDIEDIFHQRWVSTYLKGRPIIILTGHRYKRYEILKWADFLKKDFGVSGLAHLLWVVNLHKVPWTTSRNTVINQWRSFTPPIPLLLDWGGVIGKALQINYEVPNIIVLDAEGRLAFHEIHSFTPEVYAAVASRIFALAQCSPSAIRPPMNIDSGVPIGTIPQGKNGFSN